MQRFNMDLNSSSACCQRLLVICLVALTSLAGAAHAQVRLENSIKKVETFVDEEGQVQRRLVDAASVVPGDELQYVVRFVNEGEVAVDAGTIVITDAIPAHTEYLEGSAYGSGTDIDFSLDGKSFAEAAELTIAMGDRQVPASAAQYNAIRWRFGPALEPGATSYVSFNVRLK